MPTVVGKGFYLYIFMVETKDKFHSNSILATNCIETPEGYRGIVESKGYSLKFSLKNVVPALAEGDIKISIEPNEGLETRPLNFHLKAYSDSNKEALARQLKLAFSEYGLTWTLIVNDLVSSFIEALNNKQQLFKTSEITSEAKAWLFEPFIQEHAINVFFGMGSAGKTLMSIFVGMLYSQGKQIHSQDARQGKVMLIDFENDAAEWRDKLYGLAGKYNIDLQALDDNFLYWQTEQIPLYNQVDRIKTAIKVNNISLAIVDSASMASGDSTSDEASALKLMAALKLLDISVLLIAHQRKNEGEDTPIGSIQYFNQARNIWHVEGKPDDFDDKVLHIGCKHRKNNNGLKIKNPIGFKAYFGQGFIEIKSEDAIVNFDDKFTVNDRIIQALKSGGMTYKQIADKTGLDPKPVSKKLNELKTKGKVMNLNEVWSLVYK